MKKLYRFLFLSSFICTSLPAYSLVVYDPAVWSETLATATNIIKQIAVVKQQLMVMKEQKKLMEKQGFTLNSNQYQWSNGQQLINQLGNIIEQNNALAYSGSNLDAQFKQNFPGYQPPENYSQQYQQITTNTLNTLNNILQSLGTNANDFQDENKRLQFLQRQEQNSDNQLRAIQAASQIASEEVTQTQLLRQTLMAQTNSQAVFYASQVQNEASSRAELVKVINNGAKTAPPIGHSGNSISIPDFSN